MKEQALRLALAGLLLMIFTLLQNGGRIVNADTNIGTIPGKSPFAIAANPVTNKIYVANLNDNSVTVIDGTNNSTTTVGAGIQPFTVAVNPVTNKIYVANAGNNNVTVIDGTNNSTAFVAAGSSPNAIAINTVTNKIYVANSTSSNPANSGTGDVTVIDGTNNTPTTVGVGSAPQDIAVNMVTNKIYVANIGSSFVTVINGTDNSVTNVETGAGTGPGRVAVNMVTNKIYVTNRGSSNVTVIDGTNNSTTTVTAGAVPTVIAVNQVTNKIYVANQNSNNVTVIDGTNNSTTTAAVGSGPYHLAVNPVMNKIYVTNQGGDNVTVIDGTNNSTTTVAARTFPNGVAINPVTNKIYVVNNGSANITVIDGTPATPPNQIDLAGYFGQQQYLDFLNRLPDDVGFAFWVNQITSCGADANCIDIKRQNVSAAFYLSIEFQQTGYLVYRIYKASYGNLAGAPVPIRRSEFLPDTQKIGQGVVVNQTGWEAVLENNKKAFTLEFVQRARFTTAFPTTLTPTQFVDALFANGGVTPSASDRTTAINEFGSATTTTDVAARSRALRDAAENSTLNQQEFNRAFVLMQYFGYLRRNPNDAPEAGLNFDGYNFWLTKLNQFNGNFQNAEMVKAFISATEYRQRFGP